MSDVIKQLGVLAIGTRLKRLSDTLMEQVAEVYQSENVEFNPRFFSILTALSNSESSTVVELGKNIGISHSAVVQTLALMKKEGLVVFSNSNTDSRKTEVRLTPRAKALNHVLAPTWERLREVLQDVVTEERKTLMQHLEGLETELSTNSLIQRLRKDSSNKIEIIEWDSRYAASFRDLNEAWITRYFKMESGDEEFLSTPKKIIDDGGMVFFAKFGGMIVGTAAMLNTGKGSFELARMAVSSEMQGRGIGKKLLTYALKWTKKQRAKKIFLETSKKLKPAISLYKAAGFKELPKKQYSYARADTYMEYQA